jgi:hypothetical protein
MDYHGNNMTKFVKCYDCDNLVYATQWAGQFEKPGPHYSCKIVETILREKHETFKPWYCNTFVQVDPVERAKQELMGKL